jgi:CCR4-NOT transcription complex subunit 1
MESDENKMMKAAQLMVANLAGSLALVTCREPLRASVSTHLRQLLLNSATGSSNDSANVQLSDEVQNVIDQCVSNCSQDNLELGCMLIEKAATEKAVRDMEEAIAPALQTRKKHREQTGQPFYDMSIFNNGNQRYPASLPEPLLPKPGGLRNEQLHVYEAFRRIPRQPSVTSQQQSNTAGGNPLTPSPAEGPGSANKTASKFNMDAFTRIALKLESSITALLTSAGHRAPEITLNRIPSDHEVKQLLLAAKQISSSVAVAGSMSSAEQDSILGFAQNIFKRLYELRLSEPLRLEAFVALLDALNECCRQLSNDIGTWATYAPTDTDGQRKLHRTVLLLLLRSNLLQVIELDTYLCDRIDGGRNIVWLEFTMAFIRTALLEKIVNPKDLPKVMTVLSTVSNGSAHSNQISQLLSLIQEVNGTALNTEEKGRRTPDNVAATVSGLNALVGKPDKPTYQQSSSMSVDSLNNLAGATKRALESIESISSKDPNNLSQQVTVLLDGWMRLNNDGGSKGTLQYVQLLQQNGIGKNEEQTERFFRVSTEVLVKAVLQTATIEESKSQGQHAPMKQLNYTVMDDYGKLVSVLVRHLNTSSGSSEQIANQRISLLNQILGVTMRTMMADYERSKRDKIVWDQRPWFRLLLNLVMDLNSPSSTLDPINYGILSVFGSAFHVVQPLVVPGFAFAWLELISHRMFLSNLLQVKGQKGWALAHQLLIDLFLFLEPHLRKTELTNSIRHLYKGTLRVLLVLLHDFPAFLSGYHLSFCNVIPENCVQLRNLVLSAFSRGMILPDPFTPNLKIDRLPEISKSPVVLSNIIGPLNSIRDELDSYLKTRQPAEFVQNLLPRLYKNGGKEVDSPRVNSLVLYVGMHAIAKMQNSQVSQSLAHTAEIEIMQKLMDCNDRGRYISLNAIANQLRYPSSHTHYFSCVMLFLFSEAKDEGVREQVTRVLLERLIVHRPHPWGLLITFIELIKNQRYQFWSHPFTRCATEIEKVFESVARSCMTPGTQRSASIGDGS